METADQVAEAAEAWLARNAWRPDWFLHVHLWDPHTPYRSPGSFGEPFAGDPLPTWLTEEVRAAHWLLPGPHSAQEVAGFGPRDRVGPVAPAADRGGRHGRRAPGLRRIRHRRALRRPPRRTGARGARRPGSRRRDGRPGVVRPRREPRRTGHLLRPPDGGSAHDPPARRAHVARPGRRRGARRRGLPLPDRPDGDRARPGRGRGARQLGRRRPSPPTSPPPDRPDASTWSSPTRPWTAQRSVRFDRWICIRTYHDAFHGFPEVLLFDLAADPYEQHDVAADHPDVVDHALDALASWGSDAIARSDAGVDPLLTVLTGWRAVALADGRRRLPRPPAGHWPRPVGRPFRSAGLASGGRRPPRVPRPLSRRRSARSALRSANRSADRTARRARPDGETASGSLDPRGLRPLARTRRPPGIGPPPGPGAGSSPGPGRSTRRASTPRTSSRRSATPTCSACACRPSSAARVRASSGSRSPSRRSPSTPTRRR